MSGISFFSGLRRLGRANTTAPRMTPRMTNAYPKAHVFASNTNFASFEVHWGCRAATQPSHKQGISLHRRFTSPQTTIITCLRRRVVARLTTVCSGRNQAFDGFSKRLAIGIQTDRIAFARVHVL